MAWITHFLIDPITKGKHKALQINVFTSLDIQSRWYLKSDNFLIILRNTTFSSCLFYEEYLQPYQRQIYLISICFRSSCKVSKALGYSRDTHKISLILFSTKIFVLFMVWCGSKPRRNSGEFRLRLS